MKVNVTNTLDGGNVIEVLWWGPFGLQIQCLENVLWRA